ncbi:MAG: D-glycero-beta-D-manno-heptose-7-phosphate kinase [Burkholderiaceae bacterium]
MAEVSRRDFHDASILVVGDVMLDRYWFGDVERISPEAPVPIVRVRSAEERLGGAANVAHNAARLGAHAVLVGIVGRDEPGDRIEAMARDCGIDVRLSRDDRLPTTIKLRVVGRQQQLIRIDFEEAPGERALASKLDAVRQGLDVSGAVVLSDYGKGGLAQIDEIIAIAKAAGKVVVADPKGDDYERYRGVTVITPNRAELRAVVGTWRDEADLVDRAQRLRSSLDIDYLLLTRSEEGMSLFSAQGVRTEPAQAREVFDVSGAGDTVVAVVATALAAGESIESAVALANRAGGIVVGKLGTATVTPEEMFPS